jgi:protein-disulfide isomerase-like protein with CxxC motif
MNRQKPNSKPHGSRLPIPPDNSLQTIFSNLTILNMIPKIQRSFYVDGVDITDVDTLVTFMTPDRRKAFMDFYQSERAEVLMRHDFSKARSMGASAFPSVVRIDSDGHMVCNQGYQRFEEVL